MQGQDLIFHLAGQVSHGDSMRDPQLDLGVNCISTMNLVEACRKHASEVRLLYASTRQVYGRPTRLPVAEDHPTLPIDVNGINKLAAEYYHLLYDSVYGIRSTVLRLTIPTDRGRDSAPIVRAWQPCSFGKPCAARQLVFTAGGVSTATSTTLMTLSTRCYAPFAPTPATEKF